MKNRIIVSLGLIMSVVLVSCEKHTTTVIEKQPDQPGMQLKINDSSGSGVEVEGTKK